MSSGNQYPKSQNAARDRRRAMEREKAQMEGFASVYAKRKATRKGFGVQPESTPTREPLSRLDRLGGLNGPVRILVKDGRPVD